MEDLFLENEFYKHKKFKDICIKIVKFTGKGESGLYFNVEYWNLGCMGRPWQIGKSYNFLIRYEDVENWDIIEEDEFFSTRPKSQLYDV